MLLLKTQEEYFHFKELNGIPRIKNEHPTPAEMLELIVKYCPSCNAHRDECIAPTCIRHSWKA